MAAVAERIAIMADVHANLAALRATLADAAAQGATRIVVAGDLVGFGPQPNATVDLLRERGATLVRGNHEQDYVGQYGQATIRERWQTDRRFASLCWYLDRLGDDRSTLLTALPTEHWLDDATLVTHGSPRHIRDGIKAETPDDVLRTMFAASAATVAFVGHTHRQLIRVFGGRMVVNVGSVGTPLDDDPRAAYVLATRPADVATGSWTIAPRRVAYDIAETIAAYADGLRQVAPAFCAVMERQLRTGHSFVGPWLRLSNGLRADQERAALARFLALPTPRPVNPVAVPR